jgi:UPF0716 protein FxsA
MGWFFLLFIVLPATELALLIEVGRRIGTMNTLLLIVVTGMVGASLARWQGLSVLRQIQRETAEGRMPAAPLVDGMIILIASALLVTPGVLTDLFGFLCLVPAFRAAVRAAAWRRFERAAAEGRVVMHVHTADWEAPPRAPRVYDVEPEADDEPPWPPRLP